MAPPGAEPEGHDCTSGSDEGFSRGAALVVARLARAFYRSSRFTAVHP
jgi:hypothetical protein